MPPRMGPLVAFFLSSGPTFLLATGLGAALIALWRARRDRQSAGSEMANDAPLDRDVLRLVIIGSLLVCLLQLPFRLYLDLDSVAAEQFIAPLDRLFASVLLVVLASVLSGAIATRRGRVILASGLALPLLGWFAWAPIWQEALAAESAPLTDPTGFARPWDLLLVAVAVVFTASLVARPRAQTSSARWIPWLPAVLAIGSLIDVIAPAPAAGAPGTRLAQLSLGLLLLALARPQGRSGSAPAAGARLRRLVAGRRGASPARRQRRLRRTPREGDRLAAPPVPLAAVPALPPTPQQQLGTVAVVHDALGELDALGAATAIVMLRRGDDLETWVQVPPGKANRLGRLSRERFKTVSRALRAGGLTVDARAEVRDLDSLYDQLGVPHDGAVRIEPIGRPARGVLLAGRAHGVWEPQAQERMARLAARLDQRLAALERHGLDGNALDRMLGALEAQSASLDRVMRQVDRLAERVTHIEAPVLGPRAVSGGAVGSETPAPSELPVQAERAFAARTLAFEQALSRAPWGVVLTDAQGHVVFANDAARRILRNDMLQGRSFAEITPDPAAVAVVLEDLAGRAACDADAGDRSRVRCTAGDLRLDFEALHVPGLESAGAFVIISPEPDSAAGERGAAPPAASQTQATSTTGADRTTPATPPSATDPAAVLVPELVEALREPMKAIMTHRDVLARRTGFADTELSRHIGVVDAHLGRLDVRLTDLLTGLELATGHYQLSRSALDAEQLIDAALMRAKAQLDEKGLRIERRIGGGLPAVRGDRRALSHVLDNLLATAIDGSAHGAVISVGARQRGGPTRPSTTPSRATEPAILVFTIQYRDWWHADIADRVFAIGDGEGAAPALRIARILTEVQGGRAWGEQLGDDGRLLLNVGLPT